MSIGPIQAFGAGARHRAQGAMPLQDAVRDAQGWVIAHRSLTAEDLIACEPDPGDAAYLDAAEADIDNEE
jgi:hypothetical protein